MTTKSSLLSSIPLTKASIASNPKASFLSRHKEYASSINKTPPTAPLITSVVFTAVCPAYCPTKSALVTSHRCPDERTPIAFKYFATIRAMVVFPVPGFPTKIICMEISDFLSPFPSRIFWTL